MTQWMGTRLWPKLDALGPVTDLYQLTMMAGYRANGMDQLPAVFELFVRRLPPNRGYFVFAGLEQALLDLQHARFDVDQIAYLRDLPAFAHVAPQWFESLAELRFRGDVWSVPEGTVVFPNEPLLRIQGTLEEAQWIETFLLASLNYPTLVATKAARIVDAAEGRRVVDFGARRGHGPHSGFLCARSAYLAGFAGTSQVEAARLLGIPVVGTMAHSWAQAFPSESEAFQAYANLFPNTTTLLVDTYDTLQGVAHALEISPPIQAIRIDSGDIASLSQQARVLMDQHGRGDVKIVVSGDLEEYKIADLVQRGAPIDTFGIGTELITGGDAPALSMVYKLVTLDGVGKIKLSPAKRTYPLAKQIHRQCDSQGVILRDYITEVSEVVPGHVPLLQPMMLKGELVRDFPTLPEIQAYCKQQKESLPKEVRSLHAQHSVTLDYSDRLESEARALGVIR